MEVFLIRLLQFLMAISLLVLLHELGHFTFAKLFGVRVTKFYLFFNPKFHIVSTYDTWVRRLLKLKPEVVPTKAPEAPPSSPEGDTIDPALKTKVAPSGAEGGASEASGTEKEYVGTEYGLGWLPLGGYCAIDGMIDETNQKLSDDPKPWEFRTKPTWQRLLIMVGGVLVNFLLALFIYAMILFHWGETYVPVSEMKHGMEFNAEAKALHRPRPAEEMGRRPVPRGVEGPRGACAAPGTARDHHHPRDHGAEPAEHVQGHADVHARMDARRGRQRHPRHGSSADRHGSRRQHRGHQRHQGAQL